MSIILAICRVACALTAACWDLRFNRIPNWLTCPALLLGLALNASHGWLGLRSALLGMLAGGGIFLAVWLAKGMGGGDVKLMAALGALAGWPHIRDILFFTGLAGGVMAVFVLAFQRQPAGAQPVRWRDRRMPYGVAIAVGTILAEGIGLNWGG